MADIDRDPAEMSPHGHTEPISSYTGTAPLEAGLHVTVGPDAEEWRVIRVDPPSSDDTEGVFHLHKI
jgi:hypothetical protein